MTYITRERFCRLLEFGEGFYLYRTYGEIYSVMLGYDKYDLGALKGFIPRVYTGLFAPRHIQISLITPRRDGDQDLIKKRLAKYQRWLQEARKGPACCKCGSLNIGIVVDHFHRLNSRRSTWRRCCDCGKLEIVEWED